MTYKLFLSYPEALRPTFPRLKERLEDADAGVQAAAVNVICELARRNPQNYLSLAPILFKVSIRAMCCAGHLTSRRS
jgi:AP-3 complex subunit delta-1